MDNLPTIIEKNALELSDKKIQELNQAIARGTIGPMTADKEGNLFLLYAMGDSIDEITDSTGYPKDIILVTAMRYDWPTRRKKMRLTTPEDTATDISKKIVNGIQMATWLAVKEQIADVVSGRKRPSQCSLIPKNIHGLQKLMEMITVMNNPAVASIRPGGTVVQAENVQINHNHNLPAAEIPKEMIELTDKEKEDRAAKWAILRGKSEVIEVDPE
jgi:hypothetical protein